MIYFASIVINLAYAKEGYVRCMNGMGKIKEIDDKKNCVKLLDDAAKYLKICQRSDDELRIKKYKANLEKPKI